MGNSLLCSGRGRHRTRPPPSPPSQVPSVVSPAVSKPLTQKRFSAVPQKMKPRALHLVFCARLCPLRSSHRGRARTAAPAARAAAKRGDDVANPHHRSASATDGQEPHCHTAGLSQPQVLPDKRPALLRGGTIRAGFEHISLCCFSLVCKERGPAGHPKPSCWKS